MADYTAILDTQLDPDAPITSALGYQFRDNPEAIAEGADAAPVNASVWHPYNMTNMSLPGSGTGEGVIYDFAVDGALSEVVTPSFQYGYSYRLLLQGVTNNDSGTNQGAVFRDTSADYVDVINSFPGPSNGQHVWEILHPWQSNVNHLGTIQTVGGYSDASVNVTTSQIISGARVYPGAASNFNGGRIILEKRLDALSGAIS